MIDHTELIHAIRTVEARHDDSVLPADDREMQAIWSITGGGRKQVLVNEREYEEIKHYAMRIKAGKRISMRLTAGRLNRSTTWVRDRARAYQEDRLVIR